MKNAKGNEHVMVVRSSLLPKHGIFSGFHPALTTFREDPIRFILTDENVEFMDRADHERNEEFRAVIPYVVVSHDGWFYSYQRSKGSDSRLTSRLSIGVGGHAQFEDSLGASRPKRHMETIHCAAFRELGEEISGTELCTDAVGFRPIRYIGLINDERDHVGRTHIGVVFQFNHPFHFIKIKPGSNMANGHWASPSLLRRDIEDYEGWSKIIIQQAYGLLRQ